MNKKINKEVKQQVMTCDYKVVCYIIMLEGVTLLFLI